MIATAESLLSDISFQLGRYAAMAESIHTCKLSHLRYPYPLDSKCSGCRNQLEKFVRMNHLEMPYRLFGFAVIAEHLDRDTKRRADTARARREQGAGI